MIQRIQSIFLLLASLMLGLVFFFPLAVLVNENETFTFWYRGLYGNLHENIVLLEHSTPLAILYLLILMLCIFSIFLFKLRPVQMKLCIANIILIIIALGLTALYLFVIYSDHHAQIHFKIFSAFPILSLVFIVLAYKGIKKDEALVKSVDRIR